MRPHIANDCQLVVIFILIQLLVANIPTAPVRILYAAPVLEATKINVDAWKGLMEWRVFEETKEQGRKSVVLLLDSSYIRGTVAVLCSVPCHHRST